MKSLVVSHRYLLSNNHSFSKFKWSKVLILSLRVPWRKERKAENCQELVRQKIVAEHGHLEATW